MLNQSEHKNKRRFIAFAIVAVLVFLDQITKEIAVSQLLGKDGVDIIPNVLQLLYVENTGTAFSLLRGQMIFFYIVTVIASVAIIVCMEKLPNNKKFNISYYLLSVLLAGAIGNFIDRVLHQYVVDFIYFSLINFPVFNVADIYVTVSVAIILLLFIFYYSDEELTEAFGKKD